MLKIRFALVSILFVLLSSTSALAYDYSHVLTARPIFGSENYEAVVTWTNFDFCYLPINEASSVSVIDDEVFIVSPGAEKVPCIEPRPPLVIYQQTALIGKLAPGTYTAYWDQTDNISLSVVFTVSELQGPEVPCVGCDTLAHAPFPETGSWYNPAQSGSGLNFEIQNGVLAGYYYGYDVNGLPEWQLITGPLVRSEQQGVQWELETQLQHFQDGNCIGCEYVPPTDPTIGTTIKLEFQQRNYMRLTIGDNQSQFFVPIIYGSFGQAYFGEQTPYVFPQLGGNFIIITKPNTAPPSNWLWESKMIIITGGRVYTSGPDQGKLIYEYYHDNKPPGPDVFFDIITCELEPESNQPGCTVSYGKDYVMPIGNMSDSRFFGEAEDGSTIEGIRFNYD